MNSNWSYNPINSTQLGNLEEKHKSPEQVIIMIITTRWSDHIQENNIKVKAGLVLINYSHAVRSRDPEQWWLSETSWSRQRNIPAAQKILEISSSILVRELIVSPHSENPGLLLLKYREYLQKLYSLDTWCLTEQTNVLRSDTTSNRINHTACQIWPTMLHISWVLISPNRPISKKLGLKTILLISLRST